MKTRGKREARGGERERERERGGAGDKEGRGERQQEIKHTPISFLERQWRLTAAHLFLYLEVAPGQNFYLGSNSFDLNTNAAAGAAAAAAAAAAASAASLF